MYIHSPDVMYLWRYKFNQPHSETENVGLTHACQATESNNIFRLLDLLKEFDF